MAAYRRGHEDGNRLQPKQNRSPINPPS
ncbi:hypothetical protein MES4922_20201 [Mesorhizobium ventifaucium]|uniref:Uncharacterized protein n=1 Tax=Mesorhizobium ventifaucium TaxID=666020 RepID=A0ABM9DR84_9HYPH|nr:hypothetical protein MES4922_20201 [Mesorhizobium ventifaucium]